MAAEPRRPHLSDDRLSRVPSSACADRPAVSSVTGLLRAEPGNGARSRGGSPGPRSRAGSPGPAAEGSGVGLPGAPRCPLCGAEPPVLPRPCGRGRAGSSPHPQSTNLVSEEPLQNCPWLHGSAALSKTPVLALSSKLIPLVISLLPSEAGGGGLHFSAVQRCQELAVLGLTRNLLHKLPPGLKNLPDTEHSDCPDSLEEIPRQLCCWLSLSRVCVRSTTLHTASSTRLISVRTLDRSEKQLWCCS